MKPQDLRVGNLILLHNKPQTVTPVDILCANSKAMQGIPLTEELLKKIGRIEAVDSSIYGGVDNYACELIIDLVDGNIFEDNNALCNKINWHPIKCLHQLQNLYFALTGEELQIDLLAL